MKMILEPGRAAAVPTDARERLRIGIALSDFNNCVQLFFSVIDQHGARTWSAMREFDGRDDAKVMAEKLRELADALEKCPSTTPGVKA